MRGRNPENPKSRESGLNTVQMIEPREDDKTNTLTTVQKDNMALIGTRIRRLTTRECFRLQTVSEKNIGILLSSGVSDSQLYKMCGNGFTVDVIAYILSHL